MLPVLWKLGIEDVLLLCSAGVILLANSLSGISTNRCYRRLKENISELELKRLESRVQSLSSGCESMYSGLQVPPVGDISIEVKDSPLSSIGSDESSLVLPEAHQFPLTKYQSKSMDSLSCYMDDMHNSPRVYLLPLQGRRFPTLYYIIRE